MQDQRTVMIARASIIFIFLAAMVGIGVWLFSLQKPSPPSEYQLIAHEYIDQLGTHKDKLYFTTDEQLFSVGNGQPPELIMRFTGSQPVLSRDATYFSWYDSGKNERIIYNLTTKASVKTVPYGVLFAWQDDDEYFYLKPNNPAGLAGDAPDSEFSLVKASVTTTREEELTQPGHYTGLIAGKDFLVATKHFNDHSLSRLHYDLLSPATGAVLKVGDEKTYISQFSAPMQGLLAVNTDLQFTPNLKILTKDGTKDTKLEMSAATIGVLPGSNSKFAFLTTVQEKHAIAVYDTKDDSQKNLFMLPEEIADPSGVTVVDGTVFVAEGAGRLWRITADATK